MSHIHTNIKVLREEARLSIDDFAEAMGVEKETVINWEKGRLDPTPQEIRKMCPILRIHEEDFLERDILAEREDASRRMKKGSSRRDYNWYLGDRKVVVLYVSYIVLILASILVSFIISGALYSANQEVYQALELSKTFIYFMCFIPLSALITGVYLLVYIIKYRIVNFQWWYIFWLSTLLLVFFVLSVVLTPVVFGYAIYKGIILKGKNR